MGEQRAVDRLSHILGAKGSHHHLDDWGPQGGHDWPFWKYRMWECIGPVCFERSCDSTINPRAEPSYV